LAEYLNIEPLDLGFNSVQDEDFPMLVPREFADKIEKGNPQDPLLLQIIPSIRELETKKGYGEDPVGEAAATMAPGVLHKYQGRVLLVTTAACPIHCRYCFRRHFPYSDSLASGPNFDSAIKYIEANREITEVILSGGDPLMLNNTNLETVIKRLEQIDHLQRLRIHSRMPIIVPSRIDLELTELLKTSRFTSVLVVHCNHPNELNQSVTDALSVISNAGIIILNQSVLLHGVNDDTETLKLLSERLFSCGVLPYYLHMLDQVTGAMHFEVEPAKAMAIHSQLQNSLPGYLIPKLVYEKAGAESKIPLLL
jgi:EF-P beta-lysylation protein EpmB